MAQKYYEVTVEAMVQRTVTVEASNFADAEEQACREVKGLVGALSTEVMQAYRTDEHGNVFELLDQLTMEIKNDANKS